VDNGVEVFRTVQSVMAFTLTCVVAASPIGRAASPEEDLAAARAAYIATEYEEALKILSAPGDGVLSEQAEVYRALCLLALGRINELDGVLRGLVTRNPSFRMSEADVTPRMIAMFEGVRRSTLESIVRDRYTTAKASFDAGRFSDASAGFASVLALISANNLATGEGTGYADIGQLARGFKQLADAEIARADKAQNGVTFTTAPASAPVSTVAAPRPETIIEGVVQRYALAYSALDAKAVGRVFPSEDTSQLRYAFSKLKAQTIQAKNVAITLDPDDRAATVSMVWVVEAVPKVGSTVRAQRLTTLRMSRTPAGDWNIVARR
jgi:hypothetical protein